MKSGWERGQQLLIGTFVKKGDSGRMDGIEKDASCNNFSRRKGKGVLWSGKIGCNGYAKTTVETEEYGVRPWPSTMGEGCTCGGENFGGKKVRCSWAHVGKKKASGTATLIKGPRDRLNISIQSESGKEEFKTIKGTTRKGEKKADPLHKSNNNTDIMKRDSKGALSE